MKLLENSTCRNYLSEVVENRQLSQNMYKISVYSPAVATVSKPGQFVSVLCKDLTLRRPFSIASIDGDIFSLVYNLKGEGTMYMSALKSGVDIDVVGPFGNGFNLTKEKALLLGAGAGIAPMIFLSQAMKDQNIEHFCMAGFRTNFDIPNVRPDLIITEDGSSGVQGLIGDYIDTIVKSNNIRKIYACGPTAVLKQSVESAKKHNIAVEVAIEKVFACGNGVCMGCSIQTFENGELKNKRVCKDGPVFDGRVLVW